MAACPLPKKSAPRVAPKASVTTSHPASAAPNRAARKISVAPLLVKMTSATMTAARVITSTVMSKTTLAIISNTTNAITAPATTAADRHHP